MIRNLLAVVFAAFLLMPVTASAAIISSSGDGQTQPSGDCIANGNCQVRDFVLLAVSVSNWILGIVGSLTLAMFVYGGFMWLISQGDPNKVTQGKKIVTAAIVGLVIVFGSYVFIVFFMKSMGLQWNGTTSQPVADKVNPPTPSVVLPSDLECANNGGTCFDLVTCGPGYTFVGTGMCANSLHICCK